ncbi:MAG TPA: hypothetical protein PKY77_15260 [Phycisphaerae bacterium]|nr:hypothetical protein [Phycisphaerae bacterium]HRY68343.1 hypothetical protein [Phycisphaerae bacterium]HSA26774.1 hypothetical protein [Phycisphaerae bacterium]
MTDSLSDTFPLPALRETARRPEVVTALRRFFDETDRQIAGYHPTCWNHGHCCQFGTYGHRLYVTALEVVMYLAGGYDLPVIEQDACPHARDGRCQARTCRPLGCRVFYCDPAAREWQGPLTEERLAVLRDLHGQLGVPYFYADWMTVLRALQRD